MHVYSNTFSPQFYKRENLSQVHTCMFFFDPLVHQCICWPKCRPFILWTSQEIYKSLFYRYYHLLKYIKNDIPNKVINIFKLWKLLRMKVCSSNVSKQVLRQMEKISSIRNTIIIRRYLNIVCYSISDICWSNLSIGIVRRKSWASAACQQLKFVFAIWACQTILTSLEHLY